MVHMYTQFEVEVPVLLGTKEGSGLMTRVPKQCNYSIKSENAEY